MPDPSLPPEVVPLLDRWVGPGWTADPLFGDASVRAYYRVRLGGGGTRILAWYPEAVRESLGRVVRAHDALQGRAAVPRIVARSDAALLQEDVGDVTLYDVLRRDRAGAVPLYEKAVDLLLDFQGADTGPEPVNPPFTAEFFRNELAMTLDFYVHQHAGVTDSARLGRLEAAFERIAAIVASHPYVLTHRDYHGQNIHIVNSDLYVIDYQDMRMGPDTYDVASLLRDRGVSSLLGPATEGALVARYRDLRGAGASLERRYYETLLQRSIKILGTFAKQAITRGRTHYLDFIPSARESVRFCLDHLPEFAGLESDFPCRN